jgi:tRNA A-37 threonylcarbamoyl transferase component Bud32
VFTSETITLAPEWQRLLRPHGLDSVAGVYRYDGGLVVTRSGSTEVRRIELRDGAQLRAVFVKKYWIRRAAQLWSGLLRGVLLGRSKARREFRNLERLRQWGLDAPAAVGWGEERRLGFVVRSFLLSEAVPNALPLDRFIRDWLPGRPEAERRVLRAALILRLAEATRRLHTHRFVHHDYYWRNIILSGASLDRFWLIDAHKGSVWPGWAERRSRAKDLATLDAPAPQFFRRTDRLRFLLAYLGEARLSPRAKAFARAVLHAAEPLRSREQRRVQEARAQAA